MIAARTRSFEAPLQHRVNHEFRSFLEEWKTHDSVNTADILASFLPLVRETLAAHKNGFVAPLEGIDSLRVDHHKIWFEEKNRANSRSQSGKIKIIERRRALGWNVVSEHRREVNVDTGEEEIENIGARPTVEVVSSDDSIGYLQGYVGWEHKLGHHDPISDMFSLGMILASLALQLDFREVDDLKCFVDHRRNLFGINGSLHPAIAQAIVQMTELYRSDRPQDWKRSCEAWKTIETRRSHLRSSLRWIRYVPIRFQKHAVSPFSLVFAIGSLM